MRSSSKKLSAKVTYKLSEASIQNYRQGPKSRLTFENLTCPGDLHLPPEGHPFFLVRSHKRFRIWWNALITMLSVYVLAIVPFCLSFSSPSIAHLIINLVIDLIFLFDIVLNFLTTYHNKKLEIKDLKLIAKYYLKRGFLFDLLSVVPLDLIVGLSSDTSSNFFIFSWAINLLKSVKITRTKNVLKHWQTRQSIKALCRVTELAIYMFLWVHVTACIWFALIKNNILWTSALTEFGLYDLIYSGQVDSQYFISFYYSTWLVIGNQVSPQTESEYTAASLFMLLGIIGMIVLTTEMTVILSNLFEQESFFEHFIDCARSNLESMKFPNNLTVIVLDRLAKTHSYLRSHEEDETFSKFVSPSIKVRISKALYDPVLKTNPVFSAEEGLLTFLMNKIEIRFLKDEEEVVTEGQVAKSLFFLIDGEIKVTSFNYSKQKAEKVCFLQRGSHFGEIGLLFGCERRASCISEGYSTVAELQKNDFFFLCSQNSLIVPKLREFAGNYNDWTKEFIIKAMKSQEYFKTLPEKVVNELPFAMRLKKIEKNRYLFKPGEKCEEILVLIAGKLELTVTVNDRYLQYLKVKEDIAEEDTLGPKNNEKILDYSLRNFDLFSVDGLKRKPEIFPYFTRSGELRYSKNEEKIPIDAQRIGKYLQEVIVCNINPGALINSRLVLFGQVFQLQCKAVAASIIGTISVKDIRNYSESYFSFKKGMIREMKKVNPMNLKNLPLFLDVIQKQDKKETFKFLFKETVLKVIFSNRAERMQSRGISGLCNKIKAILACQATGETETEERIIEGKVIPDHVTENGKLIRKNNDKTSDLSCLHPIIEKFKHSIRKLSNPKGTCLTNYNKLAQEILNESQRTNELKKSLKDVLENLKSFNYSYRCRHDLPEDIPRPQAKSKNLLDSL